MADNSLTALLSSQAQIETMIQKYKTSLSSKTVTPLDNKKTTLTAKLNVLNALKTRMQSLYDVSKGMLATDSTSKFSVYSVAAADTAIVSGSANSSAAAGSHSLFVNSLAKSDSVVSSKFSSSGNTIVDTEMTTEEKNSGSAMRQIKISIGGVEKGTISIQLHSGTTTDSNSTVLTAIATAIKSSADLKDFVTASVVSVTPAESKLVFTSKSTGATNTISLEDVNGTLLETIGLSDSIFSSRSGVSTNSAADDPVSAPGGFLTAGNAANLNAKFILNGIEMTRETNTVSDALSGVTLNLKSAQKENDNPTQFSVEIAKDQIKYNVQNFIVNFNNVLLYIKAQTAIDPQNNVRQILATETSYTSLRYNLQAISRSVVDTVTAGNPDVLSKIGITAGADGSLQISDSTKLDAALSGSTAPLAELFQSANGIAAQIKTMVEPYVDSSGAMAKATTNVSLQIAATTNKIKAEQKRITKQVDKFRNDFAKMQTAVSKAAQQLSTVKTILSSSLYYTA